MALGDIIRKTWTENILFSVLVELTYRCNLDCFFCYNDLGLRGAPLTREEYVRFFEDLRDMQVLHLVLTGGEPLAHPDFLFLGAKARELGFVVRLKSNGHALHGNLARRIKEEVAPYIVEVSLHGAKAETHDRQTRVAGSFDRLMKNLREMLDVGLRVKINSTLTAYNENEIAEMFAIADDLGVRIQFDPEVTPRDDGDRSALSITVSAEGLKNLFRMERDRALRALRKGADSPEPIGRGDSPELSATGVGPRRLKEDDAPRHAPDSPEPIGRGGGAPRHAPIEVLRQADDGLPAPAGGKHCGAGSAGIAVDPYGNVYPCVQWRRPAGNLHAQSIKEIWANSRTFTEVRELTVGARKLVESYGPRGALMCFCPGSAEANTGNPVAIYDGVIRRMEIAEEVQAGGGAAFSPSKEKIFLPVIG